MAQLVLVDSVGVKAAPNLEQALQLVETRLLAWASNAEAYNNILGQVFGTTASTAAASALKSALKGSGLGLGLKLLSGATLRGINGAYANAAAVGGERIYLNDNWLQSASAMRIEEVLLEEIGHAIDSRLNGTRDSLGDEGELFSLILRGIAPTPSELGRIQREDDQASILVDGVQVMIEMDAAPSPILSLADDSGSSATDRISKSGIVNVGGLQSGASWEYSINAGSTWSSGSGSSFVVVSGIYAAGRIVARQRTLAGNISAIGQLGETTIDILAPLAGNLALAADFKDSGASSSDRISNDRDFRLSLSGAETGSVLAYQLSFNGGSWTNSTANQISLADGSYQFRALVSDLAGNISYSNSQSVTVDTIAVAGAVVFAADFSDSGGSSSDRLTNDREFSLSLSGAESVSRVAYQRSFNGGSWTATPAGQAYLVDGSYAFRALVTDLAGNVAYSHSQSVTIDSLAPAVGS